MQQEQKVPENVARRQQRDEKLRNQRTKDRETRRAHNKDLRARWLKNGEAFENEYRALERTTIDQSRKARAEGGFYVPAEAKLILVVRIRG